MESEIDGVGKLHPLQHGFRLPISHVRIVVEVGKIARRMSSIWVGCIAKITRTRRSRDSGLSAVLDGWNPASVSGLDELIKGCVDKRWDASLRFAAVVVTSRRPSRVPIRLRRDPFTPRLTRSQFWVRFK